MSLQGSGGATSGFSIDKRFTALELISLRDCTTNEAERPALLVQGGARVKKTLCVGGDIITEGDSVIEGNLTVLGSKTVTHSIFVTVEDRNICLGNVSSELASDVTANTGGIMVKSLAGESKSWVWMQDVGPGGAWNSNQDINLGAGRIENDGMPGCPGCGADTALTGTDYRINGNSVLNTTTLGNSVVNSMLETVATLRKGAIDNAITITSTTPGNPTCIATATPHCLLVSDNIVIANASAELDGCHTVSSVISPTEFKVAVLTTGAPVTMGTVRGPHFPVNVGTSPITGGSLTIPCGDLEDYAICANGMVKINGDVQINGNIVVEDVIADRVVANVGSFELLDADYACLTEIETMTIDPKVGAEIQVGGSLVPSTSLVYDIGSVASKWRHGYFNDMTVCNDLEVLGNVTYIGSQVFLVQDNFVVVNVPPQVPDCDGGFVIQRFQQDNDTCAGDIVDAPAQLTGTITSAMTGNVTLDAGASAELNFYRDWWVKVTDGAGAMQVRQIASYDGTTKTAELTSDWTIVPTGGDGYALYACNYTGAYWDESDKKWVLACTSNAAVKTVRREQRFLESLCLQDLVAAGNVTGNALYIMGDATIEGDLTVTGNVSFLAPLTYAIASDELIVGSTSASAAYYTVWNQSQLGGYTNRQLVMWVVPGSSTRDLIVSIVNNGGASLGSLTVLGGAATGMYTIPFSSPGADTRLDIEVYRSAGAGTNPTIFGINLDFS